MAEINSPEGLISNFQTQLEHQWHRLRELEGNDSARGSSYESALQELLNKYFGGRFDILKNCSIMDAELACFTTFERDAQNEIDVVGLFSHATPRIVLRETDMKWVPLEGVSFICEVKSRVDKGRLKSDLEKLQIIQKLEKDPEDRFPVAVTGDYTVNHQIHCLVYDRAGIADDTMNSLLKDCDAWDLVLIVEDDSLIINKTLPASEYVKFQAIVSQMTNGENGDGIQQNQSSEESNCISLDNGLAWFMMALSVSIPIPIGISTSSSFSQLIRQSVTHIQIGATTKVSD